MRSIGLLSAVCLAVTSVACGGRAEGGAPAAKNDGAASEAPRAAARAALTVVGEKAGTHGLAATDAWFIRSGDAYFDFYLTNHAMTQRDAYDPAFPLGTGKVLVIAAAQNQDGTAIRPGQTFTFNSSANSRLSVVIRSAAGMETFTIVDDRSVGTLVLSEISADRVSGTIDVAKDGKSVRGAFTARRLGS